MNAVLLNAKDNVAVALCALSKGDVVSVEIGSQNADVHVLEPIPYQHKIAVIDIREGSDVIKYGESIGKAVAGVSAGAHVHTHNMKGIRAKS